MIPRAFSKWMVFSGLTLILLTFWGTTNHLFPFYPHTYPFAWYGLILLLDGFLWWRWDEGLVLKRPLQFLTLLFWSAVFWFFFEAWNLRLQNWYYAGVSPEAWWAHAEAYLDFATVLPGLFLVYRLLCRLEIPRSVKTRFSLEKKTRHLFVWIGLAMVVLPLVWPDYFFPLVWGSLVFLLEPVMAKRGGFSLLRKAEKGEWTTLVRLLIAGALCGGYWELCNYWSLAKWVYTVPFFSEGKLFEMPYLGFLGFPLLAVECFVMTNTIFWLRAGPHWDPGFPRKAGAGKLGKGGYLLVMALGLLFSEWSYSQMVGRTIDSRSEELHGILEDISVTEAEKLTKASWRYPEEVLDHWQKTRHLVSEPFREAVRRRLDLASLLHMGSPNARLLEKAGILSREELAVQKPDDLFLRLVRWNQTLRLRKSPLLKRRVVAWVTGARRESAVH